MADQMSTERRGIPKSLLFRYSLRTLLLVMTLVAIALGLLGYQVQKARRQEVALRQIEALGGVPLRTIQSGGVFYGGVFYSGGTIPEPRFKWLLGEAYFVYVPYINLQSPTITADDIRSMVPLIEQIRQKEGLNEAGKTYIVLDLAGNPNADEELIGFLRQRLPQCRVMSDLVGQPAINSYK